MAENAKSRKAKTPNQNGENRQDISETTAEITTEITKTTKSGSLAPAKRKARRGSRETSSSLPLFAEAEKKSVASVNGKRSLLVPVEALDLANRLATKAKLSVSQRDQIAEHAAHGDDGRAYVLQCEQIADSKPRENWAQAFLAAFRDGWQPAVKTTVVTVKEVKRQQRRQAEAVDPRDNLSDEELSAQTALLRELRVNL